MSKESSKDPKDPFGGLLYRQQVVPLDAKKEEKISTFKEKRDELKQTVLESADRAALEFEAARLKTETGKLQLEYQNIQRQLGAPESVASAAVPVFGGTAAALVEILQLGQKTGIDVTPLIRQVLTGQQASLAPAPAPADTSGVPSWLGGALGKMLEKSFEANTKPHEDAAMAVLQEKMKTQELLINKELETIKNMLQMQRGGEVDPNKAAVDNVKNLALLIQTVKSLSPEPAPAPVSGNSAELAFKYQDRQWQHEEAKINADIERQKIAANIQVEQQKLEQGRDNLAQIPQMIGAVVAQSLMEGGKNKGASASAAAPQKQRINLAVSKSKSLPHGVISIKCPDCQQEVSFATSAKTANCVACGVGFNIVLKETEGGPTNVETTDIPAPTPAPETPEATSDDYLFSRSRGQ